MKRVDPAQVSRPYLLLCDIYPFISGDDAAAALRARITLKLTCLLHEKVTMQGSMAIENPFIRNLVLSQRELLSSGSIVLDLRASCQSFNELIKTKHGLKADDKMLQAADVLDANCLETVAFNIQDTSRQYAIEMERALRALKLKARNKNVKHALDEGIERLAKLEGTLTFDKAATLVDKTYIRSAVRNVATLLAAART